MQTDEQLNIKPKSSVRFQIYSLSCLSGEYLDHLHVTHFTLTHYCTLKKVSHTYMGSRGSSPSAASADCGRARPVEARSTAVNTALGKLPNTDSTCP